MLHSGNVLHLVWSCIFLRRALPLVRRLRGEVDGMLLRLMLLLLLLLGMHW